MQKILLITPPFTQLNTPYPATAFLKGFLDEQKIESRQCDLSIELFNQVFKQDFIAQVFIEAEEQAKELVYLNYNDSYKINPSLIEWRFCNEKPLDTPMYTDRFKKE